MILSELRTMGGPNMWSDIPKLLVLRMNTNIDLQTAIEKLSGWATRHLQLSPDKNAETAPAFFLTSLVASLTRHLQPEPDELFTDRKVLGPGSYYALIEYRDKDAGTEAAYSACEIVDALLRGEEPIPLENAKAKIKDIYADAFLGPSTSTIVEAAIKRDIPVRRSPGGFIVFGQGAYQKRISASISEHTSDISVDIAGDKDLTKELLAEALVPVPKGFLVRKEESLEKLLPRIEFPVVVKPLNANQGKGITSNIMNVGALTAAFKLAKTFSNAVIIEKHITGNDYRFLVVGNKLIAVAHRVPACVTGNGISTIRQLVDQVNADPLRGDGHGKVLTKIKIDESTVNILKAKGLTPDSVIEKDVCLLLKDTANLSTGGTAIDVTDAVHPDNVVLAERVASLIGLDICGIDIMAPGVATPILENGGAVLEVNAAPGLRMHVAPSEGKPREIGGPIIDLMYPEGSKSRVPIVAITGTNGKTTTSRLMAYTAGAQGFRVGFTTTEGIYLNTTRIFKGDCTGPQSTKLILQEPSVEFAVLECARGGIIRSGLAFDQCDIGIVTNVAADHLGLKDIYSVEDLAAVKSVVPKSVKPGGYAILNASDDLVYNMKYGLKCKVALFSIDAENSRISEHCLQGGYAAVLTKQKDIVIFHGDKHIVIGNVKDIPLTMDGKADFMIENVLPVALASYLLNFSLDKVRRSLQTFMPSTEQTPGRLNKFEISGINILLDYAHNPHGLKALGKYLRNIGSTVTGIITAVGDRRDEDIVEVGRVAAEMYDEVIIRFDKDTRGRSTGEIADLIIKGFQETKPDLRYYIIADSEAALRFAIQNSEKGSYVVISADDAIDTIGLVQKLSKQLNTQEV